jgi:D-alanyl-D-alanine carboxypeptidase
MKPLSNKTNTKEKPEKKLARNDQVIWWLVLSLFLISIAVSSIIWTWPKIEKIEAQNNNLIQAPTTSPQKIIFEDLQVEAKSFIIYDPQTEKIIFGKDTETARPLASLTKVMTALTAYKLVSLQDTVVIIDENALAEDGESGFRPYSVWRLKNLLDLTLMSSSNDGAKAIANTVSAISAKDFISEMNREALDLGLASTNFFNATGLDLPSGGAGAYGSPKDVAKLFAYLIQNHPDLLSATRLNNLVGTSLENDRYYASNTNILANEIPGLVASKTGYTQTAGGNLAVVANLGLNRPIIFVVMGSSQTGRFHDMKKLINKTQDYLAQMNI